ncbi:hypothetical protein RJ641_001614 [Dillenia turbinata]|uniref:C2HC NPR-type domain-containing protein n=1 Tax=Dillenia turbinata TaxID=194707 RepID=A0AAN8VCU1_9MAGN
MYKAEKQISGYDYGVLASKLWAYEDLGLSKYTTTTIGKSASENPSKHLEKITFLTSGKLKPSPPDVSTCVDNGCPHDACRPDIDFVVELMYASAIFQVPELVSLFRIYPSHFILLVIHVAVRWKEPSTMVALLSQGACASEPKWDGQTAVSTAG